MELKFSLISPCYNTPWHEIERNIESVLDQDYKNWEHIYVFNGNWGEKRKIIKRVKQLYPHIIIVDIGWANVCNARNKGAEVATGDVFSFLSADLALHPGTLRTWLIELNKHPECGFVYSGYRLFPDVVNDMFLSESFDEYKLTCFNYIDGANPVRRKANAEFDPTIPSLNDWDWILSIVEKGNKGYYIPEPLFSAEAPKPGGLSHDSSTNWLRRVHQVQRKHGIPQRKICTTSLINPQEALRIAKLCGFDYHPIPAQKPHHWDALYCYGFASDDAALQMQAAMLGGYCAATHKILHWAGLDIIILAKREWGQVDALKLGIFDQFKAHWVSTENDRIALGDRMGLKNVKLIYPPISPYTDGKLGEWIYINAPEIPDLAYHMREAMPDQEFVMSPEAERLASVPKISIHFGDPVENVIKAVLRGSWTVCERSMPYVGLLKVTEGGLPEIRRQLVATIRELDKKGIEKDEIAIKFYRKNTNYFKQKVEKIAQMPRKLGRLEDVVDTMPKEFIN